MGAITTALFFRSRTAEMIADVPIIDIDAFLSDPTSAAARAEADKCAFGLIKYGCLVVKDSRAKDEANDAFLDVMEDYFSQDQEALERDLRPEVGYQVGATLENTERPKCGTDEGCQAVIRAHARSWPRHRREHLLP